MKITYILTALTLGLLLNEMTVAGGCTKKQWEECAKHYGGLGVNCQDGKCYPG